MRLTKSLPLPRDRIETQKVAKHNGIGAGMSYENYSSVGVVNRPEMSVIRCHWPDSVIVQRGFETGHHPIVE